MHWPVSTCVRHVEKEGIIRLLLQMIRHKVCRIVADCVRVVETLRLILGVIDRCDVLIPTAQGSRVKKAASPGDGTIKTIKTSLQRPVGPVGVGPRMPRHVPFTGHVILVTRTS